MENNNIDWSEFSNGEIEVKIKELEFEYERVEFEIKEKYKKLGELSSNYKKGKTTLEKRTNPNKFK